MPVTFQAVGAIAVDSVNAFVDVVAPTCAADDILVCSLMGKDNIDHQGPAAGGWTEIGTQTNNTANMTSSHWWKRAVGADSGATFRFTKSTDNNIFFAGVISAWRGAVLSGSPIDATTPTVSNNASSDTVTYADFNPTRTDLTIIMSGIYAEDQTTAGTVSGTDPAFTNRYDLETATGTDCSFFGYSGVTTTGNATGARSHTTTSMTDAISQGWMFGLLPQITAVLTGTTVPTSTEAQIVSGGRTTIITLTDDQWVASGATFDGQRDEIIAGCDSAQSEAAGWDAVVKAGQTVGGVVRTSNTVVTITWDAFPSYDITATETITVTVPSTAVLSGVSTVATPTFTVTATVTDRVKDVIGGTGIVPFRR